jgi:hypothetical protein
MSALLNELIYCWTSLPAIINYEFTDNRPECEGPEVIMRKSQFKKSECTQSQVFVLNRDIKEVNNPLNR